MARERSPARETAEKMYIDSGGSMKLRDIASELGLGDTQIRKWKSIDRWDDKLTGNVTVAGNSNVTNPPKKRGAPLGSKNALGNRGGKGGPPKNSNAVKHGFFQRYFPPETVEIMEQIETSSPLDILWDNIVIQYTAIIRAQQIMYVRDQDDKTTTKIEEKSGNVIGERWEVQQAWDKQSNFLQAQSRAMTTLQGLIKQYDELLKTDLATKEQKLRIAKIKGEVALLDQKANKDDNKPIEIRIVRKGERP
ncbi:phage terminase small subunit [Paenibacillus vulneris]|uniref:Phage terminase small subunit n=1 Tax=Paenibacillus vulneris TaxID=1133364 RepID=A0ABW3UXF3_9BACL